MSSASMANDKMAGSKVVGSAEVGLSFPIAKIRAVLPDSDNGKSGPIYSGKGTDPMDDEVKNP